MAQLRAKSIFLFGEYFFQDLQMSPSVYHNVVSPAMPGLYGLDRRTGQILLLLVDGHIQSAAPISSFYITRQPGINLSSATVRSIFACLEEDGYLFSPHRSAGRLPTQKAYRYYIDHLAPPSRKYIREEEERYIQKEYLKRELSIEGILTTTARMLSILTNYATVILGPTVHGLVLKHVELIDMGADEVLVVFVTRSGRVLSQKIFVEEHIPENILRSISRQLNQTFQGRDLSEIHASLRSQVKNDDDRYYRALARALEQNFGVVLRDRNIYKEGLDRLHPRVRQESLDHLNELIVCRALDPLIWHGGEKAEYLDIIIAGECDKNLSEISIVSGSYKMGEKCIGSVSVIGPNRMKYHRVLTLVEYIRHIVSNMITRMSN